MTTNLLKEKLAAINARNARKAEIETKNAANQLVPDNPTETQGNADVYAPLPEEQAIDAAIDAKQESAATTVSEEQQATVVASKQSTTNVIDNERPKFRKMNMEDQGNDSIATTLNEMNQAEQQGDSADSQVEQAGSALLSAVDSPEKQSRAARLKAGMKKREEKRVQEAVQASVIGTFPVYYSRMGGIVSGTVLLSLKEIDEITVYESVLMKPYGSFSKIVLKDRMQRNIDTKRATVISEYLRNEGNETDFHYFPPIIAVPATGAVYDRLIPDSDQTEQGTVELHRNDLSISDGQHRKKGIEDALKWYDTKIEQAKQAIQAIETKSGKEPAVEYENLTIDQVKAKQAEYQAKLDELASERIPVVIAVLRPPVAMEGAIEHNDLEKIQQLFSDINKNARKTSKILNTVFDHSGVVSILSKAVAKELEGESATGMIDTEHGTASKTGPYMASLVNLTSLFQPDTKIKSVVMKMLADPESKLSQEDLVAMTVSMIQAMPEYKNVQSGGTKYQELVSSLDADGKPILGSGYVCFSSGCWQALGLVLDSLLKNPMIYGDTETALGLMVSLVQRLTDSNQWRKDAGLWQGLDIIDSKNSIVNRKGAVTALQAVLLSQVDAYVREIVSASTSDETSEEASEEETETETE